MRTGPCQPIPIPYMKSKKQYFPNNIEQVMDTEFIDPPTIGEFLATIDDWHIPSSVVALIRAQNTRTGEVKEFSYQRPHAARKRLHDLLLEEDCWEVLIADDDAMSMLRSSPFPDDDDDN